MSLNENDDLHQFREYVADTFYRMSCNLGGTVPLKWRDLRPEQKKQFRQRADTELETWLSQQQPGKNFGVPPVGSETNKLQYEVEINPGLDNIQLALARDTAVKKDAVIRTALATRLDLPTVPMDLIISGRLRRVKETDAETWILDGQPLVHFWPPRTSQREDPATFSYKCYVDLDYRIYPCPNPPQPK